jgi:hypothetical protein
MRTELIDPKLKSHVSGAPDIGNVPMRAACVV